MQYETKTVFLSSDYPEFGNEEIDTFFSISGKTKVIFDLSNVDKGFDNGLGIYKTYANFGDGNYMFYDSVFNQASQAFLPPDTIEHTYSITMTANNLSGVIDFFYNNGYSTRFQFNAYVSQTNLIDIGLQNTENQLFLSNDIKKIVTFATKDNDLYNCVIIPTLLNEYSREARSTIPKQIQYDTYLQTSKRGDNVSVLSATDVLITDRTRGRENFNFVVY